ncbi:Stromelysin-3 [Orchesella cincta]|uniref:Stromelysin-3 n=1 Tax=Orchesella cincta TaxID=48709 RepID=A0A1D2MUR4_ORCCI|nr:Stromelysin-3 [Orchesella cincta]
MYLSTMKAKVLVLLIPILQVFSNPLEEYQRNWHDILNDKIQNEISGKVQKEQDLNHKWCGSKESTAAGNHGHSRHKRYALQGSRWKVNPVTYNITKYPPANVLSRETVDREVEAAFRMWQEVSNITFKREFNGKVNIVIKFEKEYHGDDEPFDGKGKMTAHAYYPNFGGSIHFDADESWTSQSNEGINFFQVATHEIESILNYSYLVTSTIFMFMRTIIADILGLEHSVVNGAVMSPFYINYRVNFRLHQDDIEGITQLYGKKVFTLCDNPKVDAATTMIDGTTYLFKGSLVYRLQNFENPVNDPGYPKEISKVFENLHGPLDAAFTRSNGITYFFKGDKFWRCTNMSMDLGFPRNVSEFFPDIPTPLDAAVVLPSDDNIYFMKGNYYWKFDHTKVPSTTYPQPMSGWIGVPSNFDAAVTSQENGYSAVYLFKGNHYWKFNDKSLSVYVTNPPYPRHTSLLLPECQNLRFYQYRSNNV